MGANEWTITAAEESTWGVENRGVMGMKRPLIIFQSSRQWIPILATGLSSSALHHCLLSHRVIKASAYASINHMVLVGLMDVAGANCKLYKSNTSNVWLQISNYTCSINHRIMANRSFQQTPLTSAGQWWPLLHGLKQSFKGIIIYCSRMRVKLRKDEKERRIEGHRSISFLAWVSETVYQDLKLAEGICRLIHHDRFLFFFLKCNPKCSQLFPEN